MDDDGKWKASTVLGAALLVEGLLSPVAIMVVAAAFVLVSWHEPGPVVVPVALHATAGENPVVFERQTNTAGKDVFERCFDASFCPIASGESALVNTKP